MTSTLTSQHLAKPHRRVRRCLPWPRAPGRAQPVAPGRPAAERRSVPRGRAPCVRLAVRGRPDDRHAQPVAGARDRASTSTTARVASTRPSARRACAMPMPARASCSGRRAARRRSSARVRPPCPARNVRAESLREDARHCADRACDRQRIAAVLEIGSAACSLAPASACAVRVFGAPKTRSGAVSPERPIRCSFRPHVSGRAGMNT